MATPSETPTLARLEDQIEWYDQKSLYSQRWYKGIKVMEILAAALIPLASASVAPSWISGVLGVFVVVLEGLQHLNQ